MSPYGLAVTFVAVAFAAGAQAFSGFGFGLLVVPLLVFVVGPHDAVVASNVLGTCLVAAMLLSQRREVAWRTVGRLALFAAAGMPLGMLAFLVLPRAWLQVAIAVAVLAATWAVARGVRISARGPVGDAVAGLLSGGLRTATSMSGPPVVLYLHGAGMEPRAFRATLSAYFFVSGVLAIPLLLLSRKAGDGALAAVTVGLPALALGWVVGSALFGRVGERAFRRALYAILVGSSAAAIGLALR